MRKKQKNESGVGWKLQYFWHRLFPPFAILCMRYPKLKTAPWLLPYFWLCRLFDFSYWKNNFHREMATPAAGGTGENVTVRPGTR